MPKRTKEEIAAEKEKEKLRALRRGSDLDRFLEGKKRTFVSYAQGARIYSMNYYSFVTLAKAAGANIRIKKKVVIDLDIIEEYLEKQCLEAVSISMIPGVKLQVLISLYQRRCRQMSDKRVGQKIKLLSVDELLGVPNSEGCVDIEIAKIHPFKDHPFKVVDDDKMKEFIGSISENGVLTPVIVRPVEGGDYEMISGNRRLYAVEQVSIDKLPAIIRDMTDDQAVITMVDANLQREEMSSYLCLRSGRKKKAIQPKVE